MVAGMLNTRDKQQSMRPFKGAILLAVGTAAMVAVAISAQATTPGTNGQILFSGDVGGHSQLFTIRPDGTGLTRLRHLRGDAVQGAWSPGGTRIALERDFARRAAVYVMGVNGSGLRQLSPRRFTFSGEPGWSPNGRLIVFGREVHDKKDHVVDQGLNVIAPSGRHFRKLTNGRNARSIRRRRISPDSKRIAFYRVRASKRNSSEPGNTAAIFTVADGRGLRGSPPTRRTMPTRAGRPTARRSSSTPTPRRIRTNWPTCSP